MARRKAILVTARQRTEAAHCRAWCRRISKAIMDDFHAQMRAKLDQPTVVDHFCDAVIGAMHEMVARPMPPEPHIYITEEPYGHQK